MKKLIATLMLTTALAAPVVAQDSTITGTVAETFGNTVILNTADGRLLVTVPNDVTVPEAGTNITATGTGSDDTFAATAISEVAGGTPVPNATAPATATAPAMTQAATPAATPEADLPPQLRGLGLTDMHVRTDSKGEDTDIHARLASGGWILAETKRGRLEEVKIDQADVPAALLDQLLPPPVRNAPQLADFARITEVEFDSDGEIEIEGIATDGMEMKLEFSTSGSIKKYEREADDRRSIDADAARAQLEQLGYTDIGFTDRSSRRVEVIARNSFGDLVEVRIDETGRVDRERLWDR